MKKAFAVPLILLLCISSVLAEDVTFFWDPSPSPEVTHYRLWIKQSSFNGTTPAEYGMTIPIPPDLLLFETGNVLEFTVHNLFANVGYFAVASALDPNDNESNFSNEVPFILSPSPPVDTTPPVITNIQSSTTPTTASITWDTNEPATSIVEYGLTTSYELGNVGSGNLVMQHGVILSNLNKNQNYHFRVRSADASGNQSVSGDYLVKPQPPGQLKKK